ncbi:response regulator transcription factor [Iamia majanohamensis]|uniref:Response regulator transcription factor n=1 Tax=Iamia majanohamensis TaxID=467976 RepID=A0AAE9Y8Z4_9ACTN|nr:response regulator transcription factor [Iamia majanohamensis]WCO68817.1 response regulator transcription factor [Iamia majanohamensis]
MTTPLRVLLVDDDPLVRSGLALMLGGAHDVEVVGEAADGDEVPDAVADLAPDLVLMDIRMARVDGITATENLRAAPRPPEVVVLTTFDSDDNVLAALRAGASAFLLKDTPPADVVDALRRVARGEPVLSPQVTRRLIEAATDAASRRQRARRRLAALSDRERDVARAIGAGQSNAEVARGLHMSVATVKAHVTHIFTKLDLGNRTQIALLAQEAEPG